MNQPDPFSPERPTLQVVAGADRSAPASLEAEQHVLACCLLDGQATLARCLAAGLRPSAFYNSANGLIFRALVDLHARGESVTIDMVHEELRNRHELEAAGGVAYLLEVSGKAPTTAHAGYMIERVVEKAVLRRVIRDCSEAVEQAYALTDGLEDFTGRTALRLQRIADFVSRRHREGHRAAAERAREHAEKILAGQIDKSRQLFLGLPHSDQVLLPFDTQNEDWYNVIAAPPSGAKSSLLRLIAGTNCQRGKRFAVFLLETGKRRWLWALAATLAQVNLRAILEAPQMLPREKIDAWREWCDIITSWMEERLWVFDDLVYFEDIERTVRELDRAARERDLAAGIPPEQARGLDGVCVDYLQLMGIREKIRQREEQVAYMSKGSKRLFKALNVSGFVAAQLNRKARDEGRRPRLSDLRESGAIEQDADRVLLLHEPETDRSGAPQSGERDIVDKELIQAKSRNGPANLYTELVFFRSQTRFAEPAVRRGDARPGAPKPSGGYKRDEGRAGA